MGWFSGKKNEEKQESPEAAAAAQEFFLPEDARKNLSELFGRFPTPVDVEVFTKPGSNDPYNDFTLKFVADLARLSDKVKARFFTLDSDEAGARGVTRSPTVLIAPDRYGIRYTGAPAGEEGRSFIAVLALASSGKSGLTEVSRELLKTLDEKRHVRVFVTPGCPYCPGQVLHAWRCAVERPDLVTAECVEIDENPDLAQSLGVGSVPHTFFSDDHAGLGLMPEERFSLELVALKEAAAILKEQDPGLKGPQDAPREVDLAVVGAGPAGLSAAIYAVRSGLSCVVLEGGIVGGQVSVTPVVENYPGFADIPGKKLMEIMAAHARQYSVVAEGVRVLAVEAAGPAFSLRTDKGLWSARAVLLATGATWRKLGVPGEERYSGFGVSFCSSCDGYLYRGRKALVVGGGNTALTDALHLKHLGVEVSIAHRRDAFRAEKHLQDSVAREGIPVFWNTVVLEVLGDGRKATAVRLKDVKGGEERELALDAVFVAIGHVPNNELAKALGLGMDQGGFVRVDAGQRTSVPRVYAAGDVTGGVMQIVTAVAEGSKAALAVFEDLSRPYWKEGPPA